MKFEIGQYGYSQWGYDQTNTDFYKVVKKTEKSVWLQPVHGVVEETGFMSGNSIASDMPHSYKNKIIVKRIKKYGDDESCGGWYGSETVWPWDNKPKMTSWYA